MAGITACSNPYRRFRFPAEVIEYAVWLYHCFSLSLRDAETILATRGIVVSYETINDWSLRFGQLFATTLKRRRPKPGLTGSSPLAGPDRTSRSRTRLHELPRIRLRAEDHCHADNANG